MSSIAWASFKNLPILIIVEDNNLSILTQKKLGGTGNQVIWQKV